MKETNTNNESIETMKVFRSILLDADEKIDTSRLGKSWTLDEIFAQDHAEDINRRRGKDGYVILEAEVSVEQIDMNNTLFAMEQRPHEYEVVLNSGEIEATILHAEWVNIDEDQEIEGHTGSREFEDYCEGYKSELTEADFIELAEEF